MSYAPIRNYPDHAPEILSQGWTHIPDTNQNGETFKKGDVLTRLEGGYSREDGTRYYDPTGTLVQQSFYLGVVSSDSQIYPLALIPEEARGYFSPYQKQNATVGAYVTKNDFIKVQSAMAGKPWISGVLNNAPYIMMTAFVAGALTGALPTSGFEGAGTFGGSVAGQGGNVFGELANAFNDTPPNINGDVPSYDYSFDGSPVDEIFTPVDTLPTDVITPQGSSVFDTVRNTATKIGGTATKIAGSLLTKAVIREVTPEPKNSRRNASITPTVVTPTNTLTPVSSTNQPIAAVTGKEWTMFAVIAFMIGLLVFAVTRR